MGSFFLPLLSAFLHYASFPPIGAWPLAFVAFIPLFIFFSRAESVWRLVTGWIIYALTFYTLSALYIPEPLFILSGVLASSVALALVIPLRKLCDRGIFFLIGCAVAVTISEYAVAVFAMMPSFIAMTGNALAGSPFLGLARFGGITVLTLFALLVNIPLTHLILGSRAWVGRFVAKQISVAVLIIVAALFVSTLALRSALMVGEGSGSVRVAVVSASSTFDDGSDMLDDSAFAHTPEGFVSIDTYIRSKLFPIAETIRVDSPDLVILPQSLFDFELSGVADPRAVREIKVINNGILLAAYADFAQWVGADTLVTMTTVGTKGEKRKSSVLIRKDGSYGGMSQKTTLTNFSEAWPFGSWIPPYWKPYLASVSAREAADSFVTLNPTGPYSVADEPFKTLTTSGGVRFGPTICSDGQYPRSVGALKKNGAQFIAHSSNHLLLDRLFGAYITLVGNLRRIEAVQSGLPIVIASKLENPGVVLPDGSLHSGFIGVAGWGHFTKDLFLR